VSTPAAPAWLADALRGHRASLARALTAVAEHTADAEAVLQAAWPRLGRATVVGLTGAPGAGKSSLLAACVGHALQQGHSIGVIAVDPSSPLTGGAVLGDRIRMLPVASDGAVLVRSLAARGHLGGLSTAAARVADVMDAAGKDLVFIESVGVGQSETEISTVAQVTVVVCAPGMGDEVQMIKAGLLETADLFAVNKSDLPGADTLLRHLRALGTLGGGEPVPVLPVSAQTGDGVPELMAAIARARAARVRDPAAERLRRVRAGLAALAQEEARLRLQRAGPLMDTLASEVLGGRTTLPSAVQALLARTFA
jgi:LAO/AO transport system kinase